MKGDKANANYYMGHTWFLKGESLPRGPSKAAWGQRETPRKVQKVHKRMKRKKSKKSRGNG